jgi:CheY-like chemotaxis protein
VIEEKLSSASTDNNLRRIPIIAMTANVFKEDIEKCLQAGMDDHAGKPLDFVDVLDKLHHYLG